MLYERVRKIKNLKNNQFQYRTVAEVCMELEKLGIQPDEFIYRQDVTICLSDYDEDNNYIEYQIDFSCGTCNWSEFV